MNVTDDEVAALRAYLCGDEALARQIRRGLDRSADAVTDTALITAAFTKAVQRRFGKASTAADVVSYVADVRSRSDDIAKTVDPQAAEQLILAVLQDGDGGDVDGRTAAAVFVVFVGALISDERLDDSETDAFLVTARRQADRWLSE